MTSDDFRQMYLTEMQEVRSMEAQLVEALPKMADTAATGQLRQALMRHLDETQSQLERIENLLRAHDVEPKEHLDASMQAMISESEKWATRVPGAPLKDAGLIGSAQRIEHYEIATYGTLANWAGQLGLQEDRAVLHALLEEEKAADERLSELAVSAVNPAV